MSYITDIKTLLGGPDNVDELLQVIVSITENRLKVLLGSEEVPDKLQYIITEVSVIRYNKVGSEGVSSHSVDGESMSFSDNDFSGYMDDIESYRDELQETKKGRVRFI